jgi:hypothetical protein
MVFKTRAARGAGDHIIPVVDSNALGGHFLNTILRGFPDALG